MKPEIKLVAESVLTQDEKMVPSPYRDSKGFWTIGVGHFIGINLENLFLPRKVLTALLSYDIDEKWNDLCELFNEKFLLDQTPARQVALLSLIFTMGKGTFSQFTKTIPAIKSENWEYAAALLLDTKWARDVDPRQREGVGRDDRIAYMLRTGEFHPEYNIVG